MKHLLRELKYYKKEVILAPLFKMLEALMDLFVPYVMKRIMDVGIANSDNGFIVGMCVVLILLAVVGLGCAVVAQYFAANAATGFSARLRALLFKRIQRMSFTELDNVGTSSLITRMTSDCDQVQNGVNLTLRLFLRSPFIVFGAMVSAFLIDTKAAMVFVVAIPVLLVLVFAVMLVLMPVYKKVQNALDGITKKTRENLKGTRVIRAFRLEKGEIKSFIEDHENLKKFQTFAGYISSVLNPVTFVLLNLATVVLIYVGAIRVDGGMITQGAVVALVNYMSQILVEIVKFANLIIQMTKAGASLNRIEDVLKKPERTGNDEDGVPMGIRTAQIAFEHVNLSYDQSPEEALHDISFEVLPGESVGIIGSTGSGKSSLVSLIPAYYEATSGGVFVNGANVKDWDKKELRRTVTTVLQKAVLLKGTVRDNLLFGLTEEEEKDVNDEVLEFVLQMADAYDFVMEKEGGLDAKVEEGGQNFSGGQKQRLALARAFLRNSDILILDDSASALDFATDARIRSNMRRMRGDQTVITVSQRASSVANCDNILVLDEGSLVGIGRHNELMETCEVYKEIVESQT